MPARARVRGSLGVDGFAKTLLLHILLDVLRAHFSAVDVALRVNGHAFGRARPSDLLGRIRDEGYYLAVLQTAHPDAALPAVVIPGDRLRFRIRYVDVVVLVDVETARPAELPHLGNEFTVLIEDL